MEDYFTEGVCGICGSRVYEREFAVFYCPKCEDLVWARRVDPPFEPTAHALAIDF